MEKEELQANLTNFTGNTCGSKDLKIKEAIKEVKKAI